MQKLRSKILYTVITLLLFVSVVLSIGGRGNSSAFANTEVSSVTSVLEDLKKASDFDIMDWQVAPTNYMLDIFQIAEGESGSL